MRIPSGLYIDNPALPILRSLVSFWGQTSANGNALGTTVVDDDLANEPSYQGLAIKLLGGDAAGQVRPIVLHPAGTNTITVPNAFTDNAGAIVQVVATTPYVIISIGAGGGVAPAVAPSIGLWMFGACDPAMAASDVTLVMPNLAGFPDDVFNNEFWIQVIHNNNAVGVAPEREIRRVTDYVGATGTFTCDVFSANVEADDLVTVFHESIMSIEVLGFGSFDTSSATVPADSTRTGLYAWETDDYFNGCMLMPTEGAARFQPRRIIDYTDGTGVFLIDPNNPFTVATGEVDYIIIGGQTEFVPAADGTNNVTPSDVTGNKASTAISVPDDVSDAIRYLKGILTALGVPTDPGDAVTLFGRNKRTIEAVHVHVLLVVTNAAALDAVLDTPLRDFLLAIGYDVVVADPADIAGNLELDFDAIVVSASCVAGDAADLENLRTALAPVMCHSAAIAVSTVFNMGTTAGTEAGQTQIEIVDNTAQWLLGLALGDIAVTAAAIIYTMATKTPNAITFAEEDTGTGNDLTMVVLRQGDDDGGTPPYAPEFDRYFVGVGNFTEINAAFTAILEELYDHILHEKRFSSEVIVTPKRVYQESIPDRDFALVAIDTALGSDPPAADAANSIVDLDQRQNRTFVLRSLWVDITSWGTGAEMTFQLWVLVNGAVTSVDSVAINVLGIKNLMDLFGLPEVHADGIWVTVITDVGNTGACSVTFRYAEARK